MGTLGGKGLIAGELQSSLHDSKCTTAAAFNVASPHKSYIILFI